MSCITNQDYISAAGAQATAIIAQARDDAAIQTVVALYQRNSSKSISNMQTEIADEQVKLAEQLHEHAKKFWPEQIELVDDAFSITKLENDYVALPAAWSTITQDALENGRQNWLDTSATKLCIDPGLCKDNRWQRNGLLIEADMASFAARQGEARVQTLNDWRYELQVSVLSLGKGRVRELMSFQSIRGAVGQNIGGMLASGINSALRTLGYYQSRRINDAWGASIRNVFQTRYSPTYTPEPTHRNPQVTVGALEPIAPAETSKANEIAEGLRIADEIYTGRTN